MNELGTNVHCGRSSKAIKRDRKIAIWAEMSIKSTIGKLEKQIIHFSVTPRNCLLADSISSYASLSHTFAPSVITLANFFGLYIGIINKKQK